MLKQKIRDKKQNTYKLCLNNLDKKYCFVPFFGIGNIINEQSGLGYDKLKIIIIF